MIKRIMIVDDSATIRQAVGLALREAGFEVLEEADGVAALLSLEREQVDMLITDLDMPRLDGVGLNANVRRRLGRRFDETGVIRRGEWSKLFRPTNDDGTPIEREEQPLFIATAQRRPAYRRSWIRGLDGVNRQIEGIAFPLRGLGRRFLGAVGVFWEVA